MAKSKTTQKQTQMVEQAEPVRAVVPDDSSSGKKPRKPIAARRVNVQYTPRIPTARCPWC